jgi:hypothetical protein
MKNAIEVIREKSREGNHQQNTSEAMKLVVDLLDDHKTDGFHSFQYFSGKKKQWKRYFEVPFTRKLEKLQSHPVG